MVWKIERWLSEVYPGEIQICAGYSARQPDNLIRPSRLRHGQKRQRATFARNPLIILAPRPGLEPGTCGLTVRRSTN
jgi:hypothetical protein